MVLTGLDWMVICGYGLLVLIIGVALAKKAGESTEQFFLGGRSMPWWLLGTSMAATTFAADTPLAITEIVRTQGVWGNWFWWIWAVGHALAVFVFSRLWRRASVVTDAEFIELRYSGKAAAFLRGAKAGVMALVFNLLVLGWVTRAMATILKETMDIPEVWALLACGVLAVFYAAMSGFWGVVITDLVQFVVATAGAVIFAVFAVRELGGLEIMLQNAETAKTGIVSLVPRILPGEPQTTKFLILMFVGWWATHNADAGGYMMQRLGSARDERHAIGGAMWFAVAHYALRAWPWILVALASLTFLPPESFSDHKAAYPRLIGLVLPAGLRGLTVACLLAAFMSTVDTHLNWGASYLVTDLYKRFWRKKAAEKHYVFAARLASVLLGVLASVAALYIDSIKGAWAVLYTIGAGLGPFLILRWFWWRVNAWTEISALLISVFAGVLLILFEIEYEYRLLSVVCASLLGAGAVTFFTRPVEMARLESFYEKVVPGGFWGPVKKSASSTFDPVMQRGIVIDLFLGIIMIYGATLGVGKLLFGAPLQAAFLLGLCFFSGLMLWIRYDRKIFFRNT